MSIQDDFLVKHQADVHLEKIDPSYHGKHDSHEKAEADIAHNLQRLGKSQYLLYADAGKSLLIVLQGLDAAGKDGVIRHIFTGVNPEGISVASFKQPTPDQLAHDFLWRVHAKAPSKGEIVIFNRSHYEDVLVVRVHNLVPEAVWAKRYDLINGFEKLLSENGTQILKFYLHISPDEQLARFAQRLDDPDRNWKISESDYTEREYWQKYIRAYEDALSLTSTKHAPWYVIPSNHKWFRNLAISQIVADTMAEMGLKLPPTRVDLAAIRRKYHSAKAEEADIASATRAAE